MDSDAVLWLFFALLWFASARYESRSRDDLLFRAFAGLFFVIGAAYEYHDYEFSVRLVVPLLAVVLVAFSFAYRDYREHGPSKGLVTWWRWWRGRKSE